MKKRAALPLSAHAAVETSRPIARTAPLRPIPELSESQKSLMAAIHTHPAFALEGAKKLLDEHFDKQD